MTLEELREEIEAVPIDYAYGEEDKIYTQLSNTMADYWNEHQDFLGEYLFDDFMTYDEAEDYLREELTSGGLDRLINAIGDISASLSMYKMDAYGNLEDIDPDDFISLKENLLEVIDDEIKAA